MNTPKKTRSETIELISSPEISTPSCSDSRINYWTMNHEERKVKKLKMEQEAKVDTPSEPKLWQLTPGWKKHTIKMRISSVNMRAYTQSPGKFVLNFTGLDESGEISVVAFDPESKSFVKSLKIGRAVEITNVRVKENRTTYQSSTGFPHKVQIFEDSIVTPLIPDTLPELEFNFGMKVAELLEIDVKLNGPFLDLVGVLCMNDGLQSSASGAYRKVYVTDDSFETIPIYLNGWQAETFGEDEEFPVVLRRFRLGEYKGNNILKSTDMSAIIRDVKNIPEANELWEKFLKMKEDQRLCSQGSLEESTKDTQDSEIEGSDESTKNIQGDEGDAKETSQPDTSESQGI